MPQNCWTFIASWLWLCAFSVPLSSAANSHYLVRQWKTEEGLPQSAVISMVQTRDGYLWVGTGRGLARFDGLRFQTYDQSDAPELSDSKIVKLFEDSQRNLWIGTEKAGVFIVATGGRINRLSMPNTASQGPVRVICEDPAGGIWLNMAKGQLYHYGNNQMRLVLDNCRGLVADNSGLIWIGTSDGRLIALGPISSPSLAAVPVAYEIPCGRLDFLLASKPGGYWRLANGRVQKWKADKLEKDLGSYPWKEGVPVLAACEDRDGNLVVGTYGNGIWWFDAEGKSTWVEGVTAPSIWCLVTDSEGNLWVGTNGGGLDRVKRQNLDLLEGTGGETVQSVCPDGNGGLWIGYRAERVDHWKTRALRRFTNLWPASISIRPGKGEFAIQSVFQDQARQVWAGGLCTIAPHFSLFTLRDEQFMPMAGQPLINADISAIYQGRDGRLWLGSQLGLACWDGHNWKVFTTRDGLSSDDVRAIADDPQGNLWVGTERGGLNRLHDGKFTVFRADPKDLPGDDVSSLYLDPQGVLWVGTSGGLGRFYQGQWKRYTTRDGLVSNKIGYLLEDDAGFLWLGSNAGLMRVDKRRLNSFSTQAPDSIPCRLFGATDGLPGECSTGSQPGACRTTDGTLWFSTTMGLATIQPAELMPNTNPPPVVIDGVLLDGQPQHADVLRGPAPTEVTVPADKESIEIHFASLNLSAPDKGLFKYRLEGHETRWTQTEAQRRFAWYSRLPHGHYRFQVQACNEDGVWNQTGASLAITVLPPFWQTWWFLSAATACLLGAIVGSVHYVSTQKLQRQLAALRQQEALERERARIARDLHDQLGANLTQVALLGEMAETDKELPAEIESHARQISQTARETTRALDEIVWTVNPSNDTLDGLINYVCKYAQEYLAIAGLKYRLEVPPQLPAIPISPELRHNVFLAAKEAVNNVVKHSKASAAWLRLRLEAGQFVLEIEDNGKGLTAADEKKGRNGLRNMRRRLEDIGGKFETAPGAEGGACVRLTAPLQN